MSLEVRTLWSSCLAAIWLTLTLFGPCDARQEPTARLIGTVVDARSAGPVAGALVSVRAVDGTHSRSALTGADGTYEIELPHAGPWSLDAVRVGYAPSIRTELDLREGSEIRHDIELIPSPLLLTGIEVAVEDSRGCRRLSEEDGGLLVRLWQEVRSVLRVVAWAEREERYEFRLMRWESAIDPFRNRVVRESREEAAWSIEPFRAASVESLLREGWIQPADDSRGGWVYHGLDAVALLSEAFMDNHCFGVRRHANQPGVVGLEFSPIDEGGPPRVTGTLWLDEQTADLRWLDFHYTAHPQTPPIPPSLTPLYSGRVEFEQVADGGWVVGRWRLRVPQFGLSLSDNDPFGERGDEAFSREFTEAMQYLPGFAQTRLREAGLGVVEIGGELLATAARTADTVEEKRSLIADRPADPVGLEPVTPRESEGVEGRVVEEGTGSPIRFAQVWLQTPQGQDLGLTLSAADGTYTLEPERQGRYRVQVRREGYSPSMSREFAWEPGEAVFLELQMSVNPIELEGVEVEVQADIRLEHQATYAGLYRRALDTAPVGRRRVYLREDLEFDDFRTVAEYVRQRNVPGLGRPGVIMAGGRRPPPGYRAGCYPHVVWAGFEAAIDVSASPGARAQYLSMQVREFEGIELYGDAGEAPLGVRPAAPEIEGCGLIVLWPRRADEDPDGGNP